MKIQIIQGQQNEYLRIYTDDDFFDSDEQISKIININFEYYQDIAIFYKAMMIGREAYFEIGYCKTFIEKFIIPYVFFNKFKYN